MIEPFYQDESATIYHSDCMEVLPALSGVGLVVTSPPYNLGTSLNDTPNEASHNRVGPSRAWGRNSHRLADGYADHNDAMPLSDYRDWQCRALDACWRSLNDAGAIFYNHKPRAQQGRVQLPTEYVPSGAILRQVIIWDRVEKAMAWSPSAYNSGHEWLLLLAKPAFRLKSRSASAVSDIWRFHPDRGTTEHPCPFPLGIPARAIETAAFTGPVLDPFMGSGTTLRAAKNAGVRAIGIDTSERYCEIAAKRCAQEVLDFGAVA